MGTSNAGYVTLTRKSYQPRLTKRFGKSIFILSHAKRFGQPRKKVDNHFYIRAGKSPFAYAVGTGFKVAPGRRQNVIGNKALSPFRRGSLKRQEAEGTIVTFQEHGDKKGSPFRAKNQKRIRLSRRIARA